MKTFLLLTVVIAAILFPAIAARDPDPRRGIRRLLLALLLFNAIYLVYVTRLHPELFVPHRPGTPPP